MVERAVRPPAGQGRVAQFLGLRLRRVAGYSVLGAIMVLCLCVHALAPNIADFAHGFVRGWKVAPPGGLVQFSILAGLPIVLTLFAAVVVGAALFGTIGAVLAATLPRMLLPMTDGAIGGIALIFLLEASGLNRALLDMGFPRITPMIVFYLVATPLTSLVWNRLPFGLDLSDTARTELPLSPEAAAEALLAFFGVGNLKPGESGDAPSPVRRTVIRMQRPELLSFLVRQEQANPNAADFRHAFRLEPLAGGGSALHVESTVAGLSPLGWWTLWSRPFARDYADHVRAVMLGETDRSMNGRILRWQQRRAAPKPAA